MLDANLQLQPSPEQAAAFGQILVWEMAAVALTVCLCMAGGMAFFTLRDICPPRSVSRQVLPGSILILAVGALAYDGFIRGPTSGVFQSVYSILGSGSPQIEFLAAGARYIAAIGTAASIFVFAAFLGLTWRPSRFDGRNDEETEAVQLRLARLRTLLYLAAAGLTSGVLGTAMRLNLQIDLSGSEESTAVARTIVRSATLAYGGFFSLWLLLGYVPAAIVLGRWSLRISQRILPKASPNEREVWRTQNELDAPRAAHLWRLLAAFSPFITSALGGPVSDAIKNLVLA